MTVSVLLDDALLTLNRAVGVLRRRHLPVQRLAVTLGDPEHGCRLTFEVATDAATARGVVEQFRKMVGVREVTLTAPPPPPTTEEP